MDKKRIKEKGLNKPNSRTFLLSTLKKQNINGAESNYTYVYHAEAYVQEGVSPS